MRGREKKYPFSWNASVRTVVMFCVLLLVASPTHAGSDEQAAFFATYDQVNTADIEVAELGVINGVSREVRTVAAMVLRDHSAVRQMARDIAKQAGISYKIPTDSKAVKTHKAVMAKLQGLKGAAFDKAYLVHESAFHRRAADAVRDVLIPAVTVAAFKKHLETVLPHFEHHYQATVEAAKALGYDVR